MLQDSILGVITCMTHALPKACEQEAQGTGTPYKRPSSKDHRDCGALHYKAGTVHVPGAEPRCQLPASCARSTRTPPIPPAGTPTLRHMLWPQSHIEDTGTRSIEGGGGGG